MMTINSEHNSQQCLAEGFAHHASIWAAEHGAPPDAQRMARNAAYRVSLATTDGDVCIMLEDLVDATTDRCEARNRLLTSGIVGTPDEPDAKPLILDDDGRLYLHRHFDFERRLAQRLIAISQQTVEVSTRFRLRLDELFTQASPNERANWQKIAVALALKRKLAIISGGPGTGKTTTVVNLLACLLEQDPAMCIALAAPTGKAAARMLEAIRQRATHLPLEIQSLLPTNSFTIHRLLGVTPNQGQFRHHAGNPLAIDALVVDEASMLDLALATRLLDAVPQHARIILLGDKNQLAAVEAGAVFSELSANPTLSADCIDSLAILTGTQAEHIVPSPPLQPTQLVNSVIWFDENYRFAKDSGIGKLAAEINRGDADGAIGCLRTKIDPSIAWIEDDNRLLDPFTMQQIVDGYAAYLAAVRTCIGDKAAVFDAFDRFRTLCAVREGTRGVMEVNRMVSRHFRQLLAHPLDPGERSEWYPGRPIIIMRNDYLLKLFNGDIGIVLPDESNHLMAYFPDSEAGYRTIAPIRLPSHETAFAMTVHKSQGSEFDSVLLLLPSQHNRVLSRELLYTGITRARSRVAMVGGEGVLRQAIELPTLRRSGLIRRIEESAKSSALKCAIDTKFQ